MVTKNYYHELSIHQKVVPIITDNLATKLDRNFNFNEFFT